MSNEELESKLAVALARIDALQQQLNGVSTRLGGIASDYSLMHGSMPSVFPASISGSSFTELSAGGGVLGARPSPARAGTLIDPGDDGCVVLAVRDVAAGQNVMTYIKVASGGSGGYDIQWNATSKSLEKRLTSAEDGDPWTTIVTFGPVCT